MKEMSNQNPQNNNWRLSTPAKVEILYGPLIQENIVVKEVEKEKNKEMSEEELNKHNRFLEVLSQIMLKLEHAERAQLQVQLFALAMDKFYQNKNQ